jgi:hypothetical protein
MELISLSNDGTACVWMDGPEGMILMRPQSPIVRLLVADANMGKVPVKVRPDGIQLSLPMQLPVIERIASAIIPEHPVDESFRRVCIELAVHLRFPPLGG